MEYGAARDTLTEADAGEGRAGVVAEMEKPFEHHATENVLVIGEWLASRLFGTARNDAPDGSEKTGRAPYRKTSSGGAMAVEGGSPDTLAVAQPLLHLAEPLVPPRARGPLVDLAVFAGEPVAAEGGPVAVSETAHQRASEARKRRPGNGREPQGREGIGLRTECRGQDCNSERSKHDEARGPGTASWRLRLAGRTCRVAGHGGGLRGTVGTKAGGGAPSGRVRLAPSPARLCLAAARGGLPPRRRPYGRSGSDTARRREW